jgi:hypothetical protein
MAGVVAKSELPVLGIEFFFKAGVGSRMAAARPKMPASKRASDNAIRDDKGLLEASFGLSMLKF